MKKGYVVTWFNSGRNYGQTLQAFALQHKLKELGYDVAVINYSDENYSHNKLLNYLKRRKRIQNDMWTIQKKFDHFVKNHIKLTKPLLSHNEICNYLKMEEPDFLICGSDQIWNPYSVSPIYFLHEMGTKNTRKIAYAVSLCDKRYMKKYMDNPQIADWIKAFDVIYVRENTGKEIIQELFSQKVETVLDPTLLFSGEEWIKVFGLQKKDRRYILCYAFSLTDEQQSYIQQRAADLNAEIVYGNVLLNRSFEADKTLWSPVDFLDMIYNAQEIVTDSFHGTVFSVLFHKNFWVFDNGTAADSDPYYNIDRMNTLLSRIELLDRVVNAAETFTYNAIDYQKVDAILACERKECIERLKNIC